MVTVAGELSEMVNRSGTLCLSVYEYFAIRIFPVLVDARPGLFVLPLGPHMRACYCKILATSDGSSGVLRIYVRCY